METDNQKCPFEIEGITLEKSEWEWNNKDTLVRRWNGNTVFIRVYKKLGGGRKIKWSKIMLELTFEIGDGKEYPAHERLYRELTGKYGKYWSKYGCGNTNGKCIMGIDDSNEENIIEEIEKNQWLQNSLSELISDVMRYVYKYEAIGEIKKNLDGNKVFHENWLVRTCLDTPYSDISETDLVVDYNAPEYGQPYIDLTQFIDDKWKLWLFTREDAKDFNNVKSEKRGHTYTDEIVKSLKIKDFNKVWRDGNDYVILDEFADVRDWLCGAERERFIKAVVVKIKYWTEEIITKYIDPQRTQSPEKPQNTTIENK